MKTKMAKYGFTSVVMITIASLYAMGCQWGLAMLLARNGGPQALGDFVLALALVSPVMLLAGMNLRIVQVSDVTSGFTLTDYLSTRAVLGGVGCITVFGLSLVLYDWTSATCSLLMALSKYVDLLSETVDGHAQKAGDHWPLIVAPLVRGTLQVLIALVALTATFTAVAAASSMIIASFLTVLVVHTPYCLFRLQDFMTSPAKWNHRLTMCATLVGTSLPASIGAFAQSMEVATPRYVLTLFHGASALGMIAPIFYMTLIVNHAAAAIQHVSISRLARLNAEAKFDTVRGILWKSFGVHLLLAVMTLSLMGLFGTHVTKVFFGPQFTPKQIDVVLIGISFAFRLMACPFATLLRSQQRFHDQCNAQLVSLMIMGLSSIAFVPGYGTTGAALSTVCSAVGYCTLTYRAVGWSSSLYRISLPTVLEKSKAA